MSRRRLGPIAVLIAAAVVAGCGSGGTTTQDRRPSVTAPGPTTSAPPNPQPTFTPGVSHPGSR